MEICICAGNFVRYRTNVTPAEKRIVDLSAKVIAMQDTDGFEPAMRELRAAIRQHLDGTRDKVADLAFVIANVSESKAAD